MASIFTANYHLDKYAGTDKPNLRDQYNAAMDKIDIQMKKNSDANVVVSTAVNNAQKAADTAKKAADAAQATANSANATANSANVTANSALSLAQTNEGEIAVNDADIAALKQTTATHTTKLSSLDGSVKANTNKITTIETSLNSKATKSELNAKFPVSIANGGTGAKDAETALRMLGAQPVVTEKKVILTHKLPSYASWNSHVPHEAIIIPELNMMSLSFSIDLSNQTSEYFTVATCSELGIPNPKTERHLAGMINGWQQAKFMTRTEEIIIRTNGNIEIQNWAQPGGTEIKYDNVASSVAFFSIYELTDPATIYLRGY